MNNLLGSFAVVLLIAMGFLIDNERGEDMTIRVAVIHLLDASDEIQDLVGKGAIDMDKAIKLRGEIIKVIEGLEDASAK